MKVLGLIPARGGSVGVPRKNLRPLLGRSLIERAFDVGTAAGCLDRIVLSTDDDEALTHAREIDLDAPFRRPAEFAKSVTAMIDVVLHALDCLADDGYEPDAVLLLQPTSPLRRPEHIRRAVELIDGHEAVCSVIEVPPTWRPHYLMRIREDGALDYFLPDGGRFTRRQDVPPAYKRDGTVFLARTDVLRTHRDFYGDDCVPLLLPTAETLSIDTEDDWNEAERLLTAG